MKRFLCIVFSAFLVFNIFSVNVFASGSESRVSMLDKVADAIYNGPSDYNDDLVIRTSTDLLLELNRLKIGYPELRVLVSDCNLASALIGATVLGGYQVAFNYCYQSHRSGSELLSYMNSYVTKNNETGNYEFGSTEAEAEAQNIYDNSGVDSIGYVNRYLLGYQDLNPDWFPDYYVFNAYRDLIKNNPDKIICFYNNGIEPTYGTDFVISDKPVYAGLIPDLSSWGSLICETTLYAEDWTTNFMTSDLGSVGCLARFYGFENNSISVYFLNNETGGQELHEIWSGMQSELKTLDIVAVAKSYADSHNLTIDSRFGAFNAYTFSSTGAMDNLYSSNGLQFGSYNYFCGSRASIPCFQTLSDLKKGTVGQSTLPVMNTFNGQGINGPITDSQVQQADQIINNYADSLMNSSGPNNGSGNNNNGNNNNGNDNNGSSLGSILEKIGSIVSTVVDGLLGIIEKVIGSLKDALDFILGFFDDISDLADNGIVQLFAEFFPFLPEEWFKVVGLIIGLALFSLILKVLFR